MKYKVGDKVLIKSLDWYNKNKSKSHGTVACGGKYFDYDMREWCGKTMTIFEVYQTCYLMKEDGFKDLWTDEMIEGLVEEESKKEVIAWMPNGKLIAEEFNDGTITTIIDKFKYNKISINTEFCDDKVELVISPDFELKQEGDKWFAVKKKNEYSKTYKECCKILGCKPIVGFAGLDDDEENLYGKFIALKRCRDAYWKIAGEEMGLGRPWEPDWEYDDTKYVLFFNKNEICHEMMKHTSYVLAFPTEEMRDTFYENFKELINSCKELL